MRLLLLSLLLALSLPLSAASRVVTLTPSLSEIMLELDSQDLLVGLLNGGARPDALADVPSIGDFGQFSLEALLSLQPDLILSMPGSISPAQQQQLIDLNLPVLELEPKRLEELGDQFVLIATAIERPERGEKLRERFREQIAALQRRYADERPLRVFYQISDRPMYTIGGDQIISDAMRLCGLQNIFADLTLPAPQVGLETVLQRDPEVILASPVQLKQWRQWQDVSAVRENRLWQVPDRGLERPSFQMIDATALLCEQVRSR